MLNLKVDQVTLLGSGVFLWSTLQKQLLISCYLVFPKTLTMHHNNDIGVVAINN